MAKRFLRIITLSVALISQSAASEAMDELELIPQKLKAQGLDEGVSFHLYHLILKAINLNKFPYFRGIIKDSIKMLSSPGTTNFHSQTLATIKSLAFPTTINVTETINRFLIELKIQYNLHDNVQRLSRDWYSTNTYKLHQQWLVSSCEKIANLSLKHLHSPLSFDMLTTKLKGLPTASILIQFFDLLKLPTHGHLEAYKLLVGLPSTIHQSSQKKDEQSRLGNSYNASLESSDDSDIIEFRSWSQHDKKIVEQKENSTKSNQDTSGTTAQKKENSKNAPRKPSSILTESKKKKLKNKVNFRDLEDVGFMSPHVHTIVRRSNETELSCASNKRKLLISSSNESFEESELNSDRTEFIHSSKKSQTTTSQNNLNGTVLTTISELIFSDYKPSFEDCKSLTKSSNDSNNAPDSSDSDIIYDFEKSTTKKRKLSTSTQKLEENN